MTNARITICTLLIYSLVSVSLVAGQTSGTTKRSSAVLPADNSSFLIDVAQMAGTDDNELYTKEALRVVKTLTSQSGKSPVFIDDDSATRELAVQSAALHLSKDFPNRRIFKINWN